MSPLRTASRIVHPSLEPPPYPFLGEARLTGQWKLGAVLQAAGLLSLLSRAGWHLAMPLTEASVLSGWDGGRLVVPREKVAPGRSPRPAQELLRELLAALFGPGFIVGRGEARKAARALDDVWGQTLAPVSADEAVVHTLDAAPFLWGPAFAGARRGLAGEIHWDEGGGEVRVRAWVAGPPGFRRRILRLGGAPGDVLAGPEARRIWDREEDGDPRELAAAGRWRAAVAAWERLPPAAEPERIERAIALVQLGRFEAALASLGGLRSVPAGAVRVRCQWLLKHLGAARAGLTDLKARELSPEQTVDLADLAARLLAGPPESREAVDAWVGRALQTGEEAGGRPLLAARLVAAEVAWDRGDPETLDRHLEAARGALDVPDLAWRWHQVRALRAQLAADGAGMREHASRALRVSRRLLARHQAAGLWNDLGFGRAQAGDLPGAERAFLHAVRLFNGCDGPRKTTLALSNLAEIRMRRGRLEGVRQILERSAARNKLAGNVRGLSHDKEMGVRFELAQGRAGAALRLFEETAAELEHQGQDVQRLRVLAARALGWLRRPAEAAAELAATPRELRLELLEPEEQPALWAHAGDLDAALREAAGTPFEPLWRTLALGELPDLFAWTALDALEPYRAARLTFDFEILAPGAVPAERLRAAAAALRAVGALPLAEVLEAHDQGPWRAVADYLQKEIAPETVAALLANAGYPEARLSWCHRDDDPQRSAQVIVAGAGGAHRLTAPLGEGWLALWSDRSGREEDAVLRTLLALIARDLGHLALASAPAAIDSPWPVFDGDPADEKVEGRRPRRVDIDGIAGESPALLAALERAARLAVSDLAILILGESGTGKELFARHIHRASPRARLPFVAVNCAAFSETLLLSDLFGHVRGAFTGADRDRAGVFEAAQGGTVFLDEIGDLPPAAQGMLLRVLQEGEVRRVGESLPRRVNVRVLAATHRGLRDMVGAGTFREDLYYRLRGGLVELPPLRDRGEDVLILAEKILSRIQSPRALRLSKEARVRLLSHSWPGNVRELQNVLSVAAALAGDDGIRPEHLDLPAPRGAAVSNLYHQEVDALRRRLVQEALAASGGNRTEAAHRLGLSRQALSYLIKQLGLI